MSGVEHIGLDCVDTESTTQGDCQFLAPAIFGLSLFAILTYIYMYIYIFTNPSAWAGYDTMSIF